MSNLEEVQEHMKVDMSAFKEQMTSMMEAMLGMKQLMESNAATATATSTAAEADPALPTAAHHPVPNMVGRERSTSGHISNPHPGYNRGAYPYSLPPNYTPPAMHEDMDHVSPLILKGEPPRHPNTVHENPREHAQGDVDSYSPFPAEGPAPNALPQPNIRGEPRNHLTQPIFADLVFIGERIEVGLKRGKFDYVSPIGASGRRTRTTGAKKKEGDAHTVTSTPAFSARARGSSDTALAQPRAPTPPQGGASQAPTPTRPHPANNAHLGLGSNMARNFSPRQDQIFTSIPMTYRDLLPSLITNQLAVRNLCIPWGSLGPLSRTVLGLEEQGLKLDRSRMVDISRGRAKHNAIEVSRSHGPKLLKDVMTSKRFIYEALQKAGVIPRSEHKEDSCLMHLGVLHDMETCPTVRDLLQQMIDQDRLKVSNKGEEEQHICMQSADKEGPKRPKPLIIHFTKDMAPQRPRHPLTVSGVWPILFPYKNSHAVPWRYAPPGGMKEEAIDVASLSTKVTNITGLSDITRSGHVFAPLGLPTQPANAKGKTKVTEGQNVKVIPTPDEEVPAEELAEGREGCGKKKVSLEEASEFLRIIQQSEFKVMEQLNKTPAKVSLLELLMSSEPHRALLVKVLNEAHVAQDISVEGFEGIVNNITTNNYLTFTKEEIPVEGRGHNRALHVSVKCMEHVMAKVLIDNGSSLNVMPKSTLEKLPFNASHMRPSSMVVRAFDGNRREVRGEIDLPI
ncbi:hypothetical protein GmHk_07G019170 [Glycine max]|nr:hypothetical protein GmHk_07G019170 [Glycine max]